MGDSVESGDLGSRPFSPSAKGVNSNSVTLWPQFAPCRSKGLGWGCSDTCVGPQPSLPSSVLWSWASSFYVFLPEVSMCAFLLPSSQAEVCVEEKNPRKASRLLHNAGMKRVSSICRFVRSYLDFFFYSLFGPRLSVMAQELWKDTDLGPGFESPLFSSQPGP